MRFNPERCPECGEPAVDVIESLFGRAELVQNEDGSYDYAGYTKMLWETQTSHNFGLDAGEPQHKLWCAGSHDWLAEREDEEVKV